MKNKGNAGKASKYDGLSSAQRERANAIYHIYGDEAFDIVKMLGGRGPGHWPTFFNNALLVNQVGSKDARYYEAIKNSFDLNQIYTVNTISKKVSEIRADLRLEPFVKRIDIQCVQSFLTVFLVIERRAMKPDGCKGALLGYRPILSIRV